MSDPTGQRPTVSSGNNAEIAFEHQQNAVALEAKANLYKVIREQLAAAYQRGQETMRAAACEVVQDCERRNKDLQIVADSEDVAKYRWAAAEADRTEGLIRVLPTVPEGEAHE